MLVGLETNGGGVFCEWWWEVVSALSYFTRCSPTPFSLNQGWEFAYKSGVRSFGTFSLSVKLVEYGSRVEFENLSGKFKELV